MENTLEKNSELLDAIQTEIESTENQEMPNAFKKYIQNIRNDKSIDELRNEFISQNKDIKSTQNGSYIESDEEYDEILKKQKTYELSRKPVDKFSDEYKVIEKIHSMGTPMDFFEKIKSVVASAQKIDISEVSDELDDEIKEILTEKVEY